MDLISYHQSPRKKQEKEWCWKGIWRNNGLKFPNDKHKRLKKLSEPKQNKHMIRAIIKFLKIKHKDKILESNKRNNIFCKGIYTEAKDVAHFPSAERTVKSVILYPVILKWRSLRLRKIQRICHQETFLKEWLKRLSKQKENKRWRNPRTPRKWENFKTEVEQTFLLPQNILNFV